MFERDLYIILPENQIYENFIQKFYGFCNIFIKTLITIEEINFRCKLLVTNKSLRHANITKLSKVVYVNQYA